MNFLNLVFSFLISIHFQEAVLTERIPSFYLEYIGEDETVKGIFESDNLEGEYQVINDTLHNKAHVWLKESSSNVLYLYRNPVGQWTVSHYLEAPYGLIYHEG